jgi:hypothetical protein
MSARRPRVLREKGSAAWPLALLATLSAEEVGERFDRLEHLITLPGESLERSLREFRLIVDELRFYTTSADAGEWLLSAAGWAVTLFSESRRLESEGARPPGDERIRGFIREDLSSARRSIHVVAGGC